MRCRCGWYDRIRAVYRKMCDSPQSRVLSLNVRFYTESSLIRLLSVSADYYIPLRGSRRFQPQPSFFLLPTSRFYNLKAIVWKAFCHTFFLERKICKESLPGENPPEASPLRCSAKTSAHSASGMLRYFPEMKSLPPYARLSSQNIEIAPQWLLFYSRYAVQGTIR